MSLTSNEAGSRLTAVTLAALLALSTLPRQPWPPSLRHKLLRRYALPAGLATYTLIAALSQPFTLMLPVRLLYKYYIAPHTSTKQRRGSCFKTNRTFAIVFSRLHVG